MGKISELAREYEKFIDKKYIYNIEDGTSFNVIFEKKRFAHLLGLHKIIDVPQFYKLANKKYSGNKAFKDVRSENIKDDQIFGSRYYSQIENRYKYFSRLEDIVFEKVVYNFDKDTASSKINADIMLYTEQDGLRLHLFLVRDKHGDMVPMTFLVEESNQYIDGQINVRISELMIKEYGKEDLVYRYIIDLSNNEVAIGNVLST